jgi:poly(3-hydroxybutyrate) depolymerase
MAHLAMLPARVLSDATRLWFKNPLNPVSYTIFGRNMAAGAELFERMTRRYGKPIFGLDQTTVDGVDVTVSEEVAWERPFCRLIRFARALPEGHAQQSRLLIVAPMSGHYATLLRGTVEAFLPHYDVYITDWADARMVPRTMGSFDLDDYIDYVMAMWRHLAEREPGLPVHTLAVCQPAVPVLAAAAVMGAENDPHVPASMTLMGGPIDTRRSPTAVNQLAAERGTDWFRANCLRTVPFPYPGASRSVYPGFLQLSGFMAMNMDRHVNAHVDMFNHLVKHDGDSAEKHREFYDEYLAVMDLTAEFYMQTIETVFVRHALPKGEMMHRGKPVNPAAITRTGLLAIEAALDLCSNLPDHMKSHYVQMNVGHYGVFNGSRFRAQVVPRIVEFTRKMDEQRGAA